MTSDTREPTISAAIERGIRQAIKDGNGITARAGRELLTALDAERAARARAEVALPSPSKLWALAEWFDAKYPNDPRPDVQTDLRHWALMICEARGIDPAILSTEVGKLGAAGVCEPEQASPESVAEPHAYERACRNTQHAGCTCMSLIDGRWCGKPRLDPVHAEPATTTTEANGE